MLPRRMTCQKLFFLSRGEGEGLGKREGAVYESDSRKAVRIHHGEFDPGSEQTLAACLKHASRAARRGDPP